MSRLRTELPLLLLLTCLFWTAEGPQAQTTPVSVADALYGEQKWKETAEAYAAQVAQQPDDGRAWYRLGASLHWLEAYGRAAKAWKGAEALAFAPSNTRYNLACAHARPGDLDTAFVWLERAIEAGFSQSRWLETDEDLAGLRDDPRFAALRDQMLRGAQPCRHDPAYRQFDFWVGTWEVYTPQGQQAGTSTIEQTLDGCLLVENWTSVDGGSGKSMNVYDAGRGRWVQLWVSSRGTVTRYEGTFADGIMRFEGAQQNPDGTRVRYTMTFAPRPDGSVRQYIEASHDDGETWQVWFDGTYRPRTAEPLPANEP